MYILYYTTALELDSDSEFAPLFELLTFPFVVLELDVCWSPVANLLVHCRATRSCSVRFCTYKVAMLPTSGSPGLQSVSKEHMERSTFEMVRAGDQLSLRISRHMLP